MSGTADALAAELMDAFTHKELPRVMSFFSEHATMIDPHYPRLVMTGKKAIEAGIAWAFESMQQPGFTLLNVLSQGNVAFAEVEADHLFRGGKRVRFNEVFVMELSDDGLITRLQAYPDYGPAGIMGFYLRVLRFLQRFSSRREIN